MGGTGRYWQKEEAKKVFAAGAKSENLRRKRRMYIRDTKRKSNSLQQKFRLPG